MSAEISRMSLVDAAEAVRERRVSSTELVQAAITRVEALQPVLNGFIRLEAEEALAKAAEIDGALARGETFGPLAGVPLAHKDMYYRRGKVATCGSEIRRTFVADRTATTIASLADAGAIYLGGLNMSEFAVGPIGHNIHFGDCHNPWNPAHAPGGSSSGSGASVAARLVYGALGSDTGGSIRIPSGMSGVVGFKPTQTRVSRYGLLPLSYSFDCAGPLTRTVRDAARLLGVIAGRDANDPTASRRPVDDYEAACGREIRGFRIGLPTSYYNQGVDEDVASAIEAAGATFGALGAELVAVEVPDHDQMNLIWPIALSAEAAAVHGRWLRERPDDYAPQVRRRIEVGLYQPATRYIEALALRPKITRAFCDMVFGACDAMLVPTVPMAAPTLAETDLGDRDDMPEMVMRISAMTRPISFLGLPSLSVPCGFTEAGLPVAFQLVGRPFAEALLCTLGDAYQQATDWHHQVPPLAADVRLGGAS